MLREGGRRVTEWKLEVCCDMMEEDMTCGGGVLMQDPEEPMLYTFGPRPGCSCQIDYCPWCGRKLRFVRTEED